MKSLGYDLDVSERRLIVDYVRVERSVIEEYDLEGLFVRLELPYPLPRL